MTLHAVTHLELALPLAPAAGIRGKHASSRESRKPRVTQLQNPQPTIAFIREREREREKEIRPNSEFGRKAKIPLNTVAADNDSDSGGGGGGDDALTAEWTTKK